MPDRPTVGQMLTFRAADVGHRLVHQHLHHLQSGTDSHGHQPLAHRCGDVGHRHGHTRRHRDRPVELFGLVVLHVVVPLLSDVLGGTPDTYHSGRYRAGDRHLKIHDYRDNLLLPWIR